MEWIKFEDREPPIGVPILVLMKNPLMINYCNIELCRGKMDNATQKELIFWKTVFVYKPGSYAMRKERRRALDPSCYWAFFSDPFILPNKTKKQTILKEKMNILEAIKNIEQAKIIRKPGCHNSPSFYLQTTFVPFGDHKIVQIDAREHKDLSKMPKKINDLKWEEIEQVGLDNIREEDYELVTEEEMIKEIQELWKKANNE